MNELMQIAQGILDVAIREGVDSIVVGLPVTSTGSLQIRNTDSQQGRRCRNFADAVAMVANSTSLTVYLVDERGTTMEAEALMRAGGRRGGTVEKDSVAAALILANFFADPSCAVQVKPPKFFRRLGFSVGGLQKSVSTADTKYTRGEGNKEV